MLLPYSDERFDRYVTKNRVIIRAQAVRLLRSQAGFEGMEPGDVEAVLVDALRKAWSEYQESRGAIATTFFIKYVQYEMLKRVNRVNDTSRVMSMPIRILEMMPRFNSYMALQHNPNNVTDLDVMRRFGVSEYVAGLLLSTYKSLRGVDMSALGDETLYRMARSSVRESRDGDGDSVMQRLMEMLPNSPKSIIEELYDMVDKRETTTKAIRTRLGCSTHYASKLSKMLAQLT